METCTDVPDFVHLIELLQAPAVYPSSDRLRKARAGRTGDVPLEPRHYTSTSRSEVYRALRERAGEYLTPGRHVLLDATFLDPQEREAARLAQNHDAEFWILECQAPDEVIRQRLLARHTDPNASDADLHVYERQRYAYAQVGPLSPPGSGCCRHIIADTTRPVREIAHGIVERLTAQSAIPWM